MEDIERLVVPYICIYEVFRRILKQRDERTALQRISNLLQGRVVDLDAELALTAARLGFEIGLPLADSIVYATARAHGATLWTQDSDFEGLEDVRYVARS